MFSAEPRCIRHGFLAILLSAAFLAACSGGGTTNIYQLPSPTPSGVPTSSSSALPTATPTAPPAGVLSVNPSALGINGLGAASSQNIEVQEIGYTGGFNETDSCAGIATVTPATGSGPSATFTATPSAAGTCTATFTDSNNQHVAVAITVTTTGFTVNTR